MKQLLQSARSGVISIEDVPSPMPSHGLVLVRTMASAVSPGTERTMATFGQKSLVGKATARPDLVRQVLDKAAKDGFAATLAAVQSRLDEPAAVGYSAAGIVVETSGGFLAGQRVVCAGAGFASHAEVIAVPPNLCAALPDEVSFEEGAFATIGAIALHGVRLAGVQLGARVGVIGLGLVGQFVAQLAKANGCFVLGIDLRADRNRLAQEVGVDAVCTPDRAIGMAEQFTRGLGLDAVLIAADTSSAEPLALAAEIARDRATVVLVGAVGMEVPRRPFFAKELQFVVSRSYGPGRYDPSYEIKGYDYPVGYVRWTEQRNLSAFVEAIAAGQIQVQPLITHRFDVSRGADAYALLSEGAEPSMGIVINYLGRANDGHVVTRSKVLREPQGSVRAGIIGTGSFARGVLLPAFASAGATFEGAASARGVSAAATARRFGCAYATTDAERVIADERVTLVVIATRHHQHAAQVLAALEAGKHVFVEKPLCLTLEELQRITDAAKRSGAPELMVGFNRRFAPYVTKIREQFASRGPLTVTCRVNAGRLPEGHWTQDAHEGGGRLLGEGCHFFDLVTHLVQSAPIEVSTTLTGVASGSDSFTSVIRYANGSTGTIVYVAEGGGALGKERVEVHGDGMSAVLDDFRTLTTVRGSRRATARAWWRRDKGHRGECRALVEALAAGQSAPIPLDEILTTTLLTLRAQESGLAGRPLAV